MVNKYSYMIDSRQGVGVLLSHLDKKAYDYGTNADGHLYQFPLTGEVQTFVNVRTFGDAGSARVTIQTNADGGVLNANRDLANLLTDLKAKEI